MATIIVCLLIVAAAVGFVAGYRRGSGSGPSVQTAGARTHFKIVPVAKRVGEKEVQRWKAYLYRADARSWVPNFSAFPTPEAALAESMGLNFQAKNIDSFAELCLEEPTDKDLPWWLSENQDPRSPLSGMDPIAGYERLSGGWHCRPGLIPCLEPAYKVDQQGHGRKTAH